MGEASKWYEGSKTGIVLKWGEKGVGYYRDDQACVVSIAKEFIPVGGCTPMKLRIEDLLNATPKEARDAAPKMSSGTVTERLARKSLDPNGPTDLSWNDDGSLSAMSKQHWEHGLWAFDTCNANAWSGGNKYLENTQADFVAVQESKLPKTECSDAEQTARNSVWRTAVGPCTVTAAAGKSAWGCHKRTNTHWHE